MDRVEARFVEEKKKTADRKQPQIEYMAEAKARAIKTAKLRELRLAKEDADRMAETFQPPKAKVQRAPRSTKGKTLFSRVLLRNPKR